MKTIIFCADGTWNGPDDDENKDGVPDITNVLKLFLSLAGQETLNDWRKSNEQEKILYEGGVVTQVAKYIHGVGDSENPLVKILGGVLGSGVVSRIVRGYTFISRNYRSGDRIVLVGFSRGAYTARALAAMIASQGLLNAGALDLDDKDMAYRLGAAVWQRYREHSVARSHRPGLMEKLVTILDDFPRYMSKPPDDHQLIKVEKIAAVAVWDTVGALGIPTGYSHDQRLDAFRFIDTSLSDKVEVAFHGIAIDERRADFSPTLWDPQPRIKQVLFAGAHADVGGGYPTQGKEGNESGLSDISLAWMIRELKAIQVSFHDDRRYTFEPDPAGYAHAPWTDHPFSKLDSGPRQIPAGLLLHSSVLKRAAAPQIRGHKFYTLHYLPDHLDRFYFDPSGKFKSAPDIVID